MHELDIDYKSPGLANIYFYSEDGGICYTSEWRYTFLALGEIEAELLYCSRNDHGVISPYTLTKDEHLTCAELVVYRAYEDPEGWGYQDLEDADKDAYYEY